MPGRCNGRALCLNTPMSAPDLGPSAHLVPPLYPASVYALPDLDALRQTAQHESEYRERIGDRQRARLQRLDDLLLYGVQRWRILRPLRLRSGNTCRHQDHAENGSDRHLRYSFGNSRPIAR